jgi:hypothetical protein
MYIVINTRNGAIVGRFYHFSDALKVCSIDCIVKTVHSMANSR